MPESPTAVILFVLGMHRSGTSALCAALRAAGASFGDHLLAPMRDVNDEGFWEDAAVVALNEALLERAGAHWYTASAALAGLDWRGDEFADLRVAAGEILARGFGPGPVAAVKDPRLCLTLPLWLAACAERQQACAVCVIDRSPLEVARSLARRDGFPVGYGLRLAQAYRQGVALHAPAAAVSLTYPELLADPAAAMRRLAAVLPALSSDPDALAAAVRGDLRHQHADHSGGVLGQPLADPGALLQAIEAAYPAEGTMAELAAALVARGLELTRVGEAHSAALATLDQRDRELEQLAAEHRAALATLDERDEQIREFDRRLAETGEHLGVALATIDERDGQITHLDGLHRHALEVIGEKDELLRQIDERLRRAKEMPGTGLLFKAMWKYAAR